MKTTIARAVLVAALAALGAAPLTMNKAWADPASTPASAQPSRTGWYHTLVDADFVARHAALPRPDGVLLIDSRPAARKFDPGHIPGAVNIPDTQFDKLTDRLPADKDALLIFYCDGVECMLSHNSAFKAEKLGYRRVRVYAAGYPDWIAGGRIGAVSVPQLKKLIDEGARFTLIDSRPKERKYDKGHIPGAISLPDSRFEALAGQLPADKASPLYFYCDGPSCRLSSDSADKAARLGYTAVKVVPDGYPEWQRLYGPAAAGQANSAPPKPQAGKESGSIAVDSFERILKEAPGSIHLIDVREPAEFAAGTFPGAVNIPIGTLEKRIDELPSDRPIVFFCGAGGRSGEAHDMAKMYRPQLETWFLDAQLSFAKDGSCAIKPN